MQKACKRSVGPEFACKTHLKAHVSSLLEQIMTKFGSHTFAVNALTASGFTLADTLLPQNEARLRAAPGIGRKSLLILQEMAREKMKNIMLVRKSTTRMLWLSRHDMTAEQRAQLGDVQVTHLNVTYNAVGLVAAQELRQLAADFNVDTIAGVFPAHIVAALFAQRVCDLEYGSSMGKELVVLMPVSIAAPAKEGETRGGGFTHSHWEKASV